MLWDEGIKRKNKTTCRKSLTGITFYGKYLTEGEKNRQHHMQNQLHYIEVLNRSVRHVKYKVLRK